MKRVAAFSVLLVVVIAAVRQGVARGASNAVKEAFAEWAE